MEVFEARNVHAVLPEISAAIMMRGVERTSRNGPVLVFPTPVTIRYCKPMERVVFWPQRNANPFLHLFEALYHIAGRNDVPFLQQFVGRMADFSDDGKSFHGSYGHRWRLAYGKDQLHFIIKGLTKNKDCRRQVLQIWDAELDLGRDSKDLPCNCTCTFQVNSAGLLDLVVFNRSNDLLLGATGVNAVQFSVLQEFIASCINVPVGQYWQVSANMHAYLNKDLEKCKPIATAERDPWSRRQPYNPYVDTIGKVAPLPLFSAGETRDLWENDLLTFMQEGTKAGYRTQFFSGVAVPMLKVHEAYRQVGAVPDVFIQALSIKAMDWSRVVWEWLDRRRKE
jgi:Thymidylate synthase